MASGHVNRADKAEHMAAPHRFCDVKIFLANSEPSTHRPNGEVPTRPLLRCIGRVNGPNADITKST